MRQHGQSGLAVAQYLEQHPAVERVLHPGLPSHPQHELHKRQTSGSSGMLSFYIRGGLAESKAFLQVRAVAPTVELIARWHPLSEL